MRTQAKNLDSFLSDSIIYFPVPHDKLECDIYALSRQGCIHDGWRVGHWPSDVP